MSFLHWQNPYLLWAEMGEKIVCFFSELRVITCSNMITITRRIERSGRSHECTYKLFVQQYSMAVNNVGVLDRSRFITRTPLPT